MNKIRTSVDSQFKKKMLLRGSLIAGCGALILFGGLFLSPGKLAQWGIWMFLIGALLIAWGLVPYRRLTLLEINPNELILEQNALVFIQQGNLTMRIPFESIDKLTFGEQRGGSGLFVDLKQPLPKKIQLASNRFNKESCQWIENTGKGNAIFFPHFSERSSACLIQEFRELATQDTKDEFYSEENL